MKNENFKAYLAYFAICIVWGTTYLAIKIGVTDLPPFLFAGFRWLVIGPLFFLFLVLRKFALPSWKDIKHLAVVGFFILGVGNGLVVFGEQWLPSGLTSLLITTLPFWIVGIESGVPSGPRLNSTIIFGLLVGLSGVGVIFSENITQIWKADYFPGIVSLLIAMMSWGGGTVYSKYNKVSVHPLMGASIQMLVAGILQTSLGFSLGEWERFYFTTESFYAFIYLAFVGSVIGYGSYMYAVQHLPISFVSTYTYINPVIALFLGWLVLEEAINLQIIIGAVIIFAGVTLVRRGTK
ncbi:MAG: EamA family transporter [Melioribacteraceae bacterium]|nr:EamA family transporter [Melioribacteraceae bacterium]